jgi:hypothetical protein
MMQELYQEGETAMDQALLTDPRFHRLLLGFDQDLAATARAAGCPRCRGVLHSARFVRKPRAMPAGLGEEFRQRLSFCCAIEGCRKRITPPSLRFLGRKVYWAAVLVLVSVMQQGATPVRVRRLEELVGVRRRTVSRWRVWWRETLVRTAFWRSARGTLRTQVGLAALPASLLERFAGDLATRLLALLRFLGPLTGGTATIRHGATVHAL